MCVCVCVCVCLSLSLSLSLCILYIYKYVCVFASFSRVQVRSRGGRWAGLSRRVGQSFAGPGEIKRREVELDPQESPEEIKSREVELGWESWITFAPPQLCYGHCFVAAPHSSSNSDQQSTQVASHWRGPQHLDIVVLAVAHGLFGLCKLWVGMCGQAIHFPPPPPTLPFPVSNKPPHFCGRWTACLLTYLPTASFQRRDKTVQFVPP